MLTYKGKHNSANVMIDNIEQELVSQLYAMLNHPAFENGYIAIMPDCHAGSGSCIGFTKQMNEYVIPNVVGVDIGCGVEAYNLGQLKLDDNDLEAFDNFINENIPSGFNSRSRELKTWHDNDPEFAHKVDMICKKMGLDFNKVKKSIGTLGGGNHYIELDKSPEKDVWLNIHTGSRNFGLQICNYHQKKAKELMKKMFIGDAYKRLEFLPISDEDGKNYIDDMKTAQQYAEINRQEIARVLIDEFFKSKAVDIIKTVHNYINFKDNIIRKGAISAHINERVLIPLNMRDGTVVGTGKGNKKWNYSAPHGAGRVLSRTKAKQQITLEKMKSDMIGIWSKSINKKTLDEAPDAYKDSQLIIDAIGETVDVNFIMKPIYNFKAN